MRILYLKKKIDDRFRFLLYSALLHMNYLDIYNNYTYPPAIPSAMNHHSPSRNVLTYEWWWWFVLSKHSQLKSDCLTINHKVKAYRLMDWWIDVLMDWWIDGWIEGLRDWLIDWLRDWLLDWCTMYNVHSSVSGSPDEEDSSGLVYSFFASLKSAIYGQQRREDRNSRYKTSLRCYS